MVENYGKLLDKRDYEIWQSNVKNDLYGQSPEKLQEIFFGKVISKMHANGTTLLSGQTGRIPEDIAPFLYFNDNISLQLCPGCPQVIDPSLLRPYLERGLVTIFMIDKFEHTFPEFEKLAYEYPEYFVGPQCYFSYKLSVLNEGLPHDPNKENDTCLGCTINSKFASIEDKLSKLKDREALGGIASIILATPTQAANYACDLLVNTVQNPTEEAINELDTVASLIYYLTSSNALRSIPQMDAKFLDSTKLFLEPLRILHDNNSEIGQYLDMIKNFRGVLSPKLIPQEKEKILAYVTKINEEVYKIQSSKKLPLMNFLSKFLMDIPTVLTNIISRGNYSDEGTYKNLVKNFKSKRLSEIESKILSKYYGVSDVGIHVWQIREHLKSIKN